jgi:hypothetical protein
MYISINTIMDDLEVINMQISSAVAEFHEWVDECKENGMSEDEILEEINNHWTEEFHSFEAAVEWFENLVI